jgi:hypothetical protein
MGGVGSKDETGKVILGNLPPGFLDEKVQPDFTAGIWSGMHTPVINAVA